MERTNSRKDFVPGQTLYLKNLNEKIKKEELIKMLYLYFSQYGSILDIVAMRKPGMRGQAFVVFIDIVTAANAMREAQNSIFFGKPMTIQYAEKKSKAVALLDGTYLSAEKRAHHKQQDEMANTESAQKEATNELKRKAPEAAQGSSKKVKPAIVVPTNVPPNKVLFVQNLPEDCSDKILQPLFQAYPGFKEVRLVPGGKGMAFVEFGNELDSGRAMVELQGFRITTDNPIYISYRQSDDGGHAEK